MTELDRKQRGDVGRRQSPHRRDRGLRSTAQRALWPAATAVAVVVILSLVFFGINSQRTNESQTAVSQPAAPASSETTGQR